MTSRVSNIARNPWRLMQVALPLLAAASVGCMGVNDRTILASQSMDTQAQVDDDEAEVLDEAPAPEAPHATAYATPDEVGGFALQGVGVYLNVVDDRAELMLYVVAPATIATFSRPTLYMTTQEGDHTATETAEL